MSGFLARRMALAGLKSLRGPFGKLIKQPKAKPSKAGDLKPKKAGDLLKKATGVFPFVGAKTSKKVALKKSGPTTIRGVNIKTKAGKEFGEKVKNQPKRIRGQKPEGMRDDLPADIDVPSFLKKNPRKKQAGGALVSLRRRGLDKGRRDMKNTFKEAKRNKPEGRMNLDDVKAVQARNKARLGNATTKALIARGLKEKKTEKGPTKNEVKAIGREFRRKTMKDGGALRDIPEGNKGLPKLPTEVRNKMGFKKDGGLVSATAKLKAQGLKDGGPVRGKARGMGAAIKGGGYNV